MRLARNPKLILDEETIPNRRRHGRLRCTQAASCLGQVVDLSASGIRIEHKGKPIMKIGDEFTIKVHSKHNDLCVTLPSRVIWMEALGRRKQLIGMAFDELDDVTRANLLELAHTISDHLIFRCA